MTEDKMKEVIGKLMTVAIPTQFITDRMEALLVLSAKARKENDDATLDGCEMQYLSLRELLKAWDEYLEQYGKQLRADSSDTETEHEDSQPGQGSV